MMIVKGRFEGLGGYPMSTQEDVLSLISGGFDSSVASHMFMRRGSRVHYCFLIWAVRHMNWVSSRWPIIYGLAILCRIRYGLLR